MNLNRTSAFAGILFFAFARQPLKSSSGVVFFVLLASFLADNFNYFFIRLIYPNSYLIGNSWKILNYLIMMWLFRKILIDQFRIVSIFVGLFLIGTVMSFFIYKISETNTFLNIYTNAAFIVFVLIGYFQLLKFPSLKLTKQPVFWILTSFFIHSSLVLLQNIFDNYLIFDQKISEDGYRIIHSINLIANISKNYILFYALVLMGKGFPASITIPKSE